jgi:hypothetical protein
LARARERRVLFTVALPYITDNVGREKFNIESEIFSLGTRESVEKVIIAVASLRCLFSPLSY